MAPDVLRQRRRRAIAPRAGGLPGGRHDRVEIAPQPAGFGASCQHSDSLARRPRRPARPELALHRGGALPHQQLVKKDPQPVHVGGRGHRAAVELLGAGVIRGHRPLVEIGQPAAGFRRIEELGDPEVEKLGLAVRSHQDVGRLQIAMDDQALMGVLDGGADLEEQIQPGLDPQSTRRGELGHRLPRHVLHDEVRPAVGGGAAVVEAGDVGMDQPGEDAPFVEEAPDDAVRVHPALDQLDGDLLLEPRLVPGGQIDGAHAPPAELGDDRGTGRSSARPPPSADLPRRRGPPPPRPARGGRPPARRRRAERRPRRSARGRRPPPHPARRRGRRGAGRARRRRAA